MSLSPLLSSSDALPSPNKINCEDLFDQIFNREENKLEVKKPKLTYCRKAFQPIKLNTITFNSNINDTHKPKCDLKETVDSLENKSTVKKSKGKNLKSSKKTGNGKMPQKKSTVNINQDSSTNISKKKEIKAKSLKEELLEAYRLAQRYNDASNFEKIENPELNIVVENDQEKIKSKKGKKYKTMKDLKTYTNHLKIDRMADKSKSETLSVFEVDPIVKIDSNSENRLNGSNRVIPIKSNGQDSKKMVCSTPYQNSSLECFTSHAMNFSPNLTFSPETTECHPAWNPATQTKHTKTNNSYLAKSAEDIINPSETITKDCQQKLKMDREIFVKEVLNLCKSEPSGENDVIPFESYINSFAEKQPGIKFSKLGKGSLAEVFLAGRLSRLDSSKVIKVIPLDKNIDDNIYSIIYMELLIMMELESSFRETAKTSNFLSMTSVCLVQGEYPEQFRVAWRDYKKRNKLAINEDLSLYQPSQMYLCIEMLYGGVDLEKYKLTNALQALSLYLQVSLSLAIAERDLEFEHRDLNWSNILVKSNSQAKISYKFENRTFEFNSAGVSASIIDFTSSRLKAKCSNGKRVLYQNIEDKDYFNGEGDCQFEVYRMMRNLNHNQWEMFTPKTNVYWLHYLVGKLLTKKFTNSVKNTRLIQVFSTIRGEVLNFTSASQFVMSESFAKLIDSF